MLDNRVRDIGIGGACGVAATLLGMNFGAVVLTSGWTSGICAGLLAACAAGLVGVRYMRSAADNEAAALVPPSYVGAFRDAWGLSMKPSEWLERQGISGVDDASLESWVHGRLAASLTPLPENRGDCLVGRTLFPERAVDLLLLVIAARHAYLRDGKEELAGKLLLALDSAHRHRPGPERSAALDLVREGLSPHLAPGGKIGLILDEAWRRHGTRESLAVGLLQMARKRRGVLAPAEFLWLKGVDRPLWFALNNLGRRGGFHVEGLAAMSHYRQEFASKERLTTPSIGEAVDSLVAYARDMRAGLVTR